MRVKTITLAFLTARLSIASQPSCINQNIKATGDNIKTGAIRPHPENKANSVYQPTSESADSKAD